MKLTKKISTWIMIGIIVLLTVAVGVETRYEEGRANAIKDWKSVISQENDQLKAGMAKASNDNLEWMKRQYALNNYRLEHDIPPIAEYSQWNFVLQMAGMVTLIALFAIVFSGGSVANEFGEGTIKLLLIRPAKRWKILLAKYLSVAFMAILMLVVLILSAILVGGVLFGFQGMGHTFLNYHNGVVTETNIFLHVLSTYGLNCVNLVMMVTLAFMISTVFRNSALAIGLGVFLMFAGNMVVVLFSKYSWVKYVLFANTDLTQYISGRPMFEGMTMTFSLLVLLAYYVVFQTVAFVGFAKRDVAA